MIALWRLQHSIVLFVGEGVCLVLMLVRSSSRLIQLFHSTSLSIMYIYIYVIKYSLLSYSLQHIITSQAFSSKSSSDFIQWYKMINASVAAPVQHLVEQVASFPPTIIVNLSL